MTVWSPFLKIGSTNPRFKQAGKIPAAEVYLRVWTWLGNRYLLTVCCNKRLLLCQDIVTNTIRTKCPY